MEKETKTQKTFEGVVVSDKMKDTIVVEISRYLKHPRYGKFINIQKKVKADDKGNTKKIGDKVVLVETTPVSKDKKFKVLS